MSLEDLTSMPNVTTKSSTTDHHLSNFEDDEAEGHPLHRQHVGRGILSRSLIRSPTIHTILPGRIRSKNQHDVVFVGDNFIRLLELQNSRYLEEIAMKADFDSPILAASIIGYSDNEAEDFVDTIVKQENDLMDCSDDERAQLPPQLLVLVLQSKRLLFLYGTSNELGALEFQTSCRVLPREVSSMQQYGELLAVDPKSRAMALADPSGHFCIMSLKSIDRMKHDFFGRERNAALMPITEERFFRVDGIILQMEFLLPPSDNPQSAILLLLVSKNGATRIVLHQWDTTLGLQNVSTRIGCSGQQLDQTDNIPLMLIPSALSTSFMLVCDHGLSSYGNVLGKISSRKTVSLPREALQNFKNSSAAPLWVQWARPPRNILRRKTTDDIYLCREDGLIHTFEISKGYDDADIRVTLHFTTGPLNCNVDKAFAVMGGRLDDAADILLAAGDMSDGGVFHCMPRKIPSCHQIISNWAPLIDLYVLPNKPGNEVGSQDRLFVCSGRGEGHGAVTELRYGLEAKIGLQVEYEDAGSMNDIWIMPDSYHNRLILLAAHPMYSTALCIDATTVDIEAVEESSYGLDLASTTLAAGIHEDALFQVTSTEIRAHVILQDSMHTTRISPSNEIFCFAKVIDSRPSIVVTISRHSDNDTTWKLSVRSFQRESKSKISLEHESSTQIVFRPASICVRQVQSSLLIGVGGSAGRIGFFLFHNMTLSKLGEGSMTPSDGDLEPSSIDSLAIIHHPDAPYNSLVVFGGCRNGLLVSSHLAFEASGSIPVIRLRNPQHHTLGNTSIQISEDPSDPTCFFVNNGRSIDRVALANKCENGQYSIDAIWLTAREKPSLLNPAIRALARVPELPGWATQELGRALICVEDEGLLISSCSSRPQTVPRRLHVKGNPIRLAHLEHLNKLAVGVEISTVTPNRVRCTRPGIEFVDIDSDTENPEDLTNPANQKPILVGKVGERIMCMTRWTPKTQDKQYGMIVIGTITANTDSTPCDGRLIFITANETAQGFSVKLNSTYRFTDMPVYAIASFGNDSLVIGLGQSLLFQTLDFRTKKWKRKAEYRLPSPARHISVVDSDIQVITMWHSVVCLKVENNKFIHVAGDQQTRHCVSHTMLTKGPVIAKAGSTGGQVIGFERKADRFLQPVFEAKLLQNITSLRRGSSRRVGTTYQECFYGTTIDGLIYHFTTLSDDEWRILSFVQLLHAQKRDPLTFENVLVESNNMHVEGDSLAVLVDRGPTYLQEVLWNDNFGRSSSKKDGVAAVQERVDHFNNLVQKLLGPSDDPANTFLIWAGHLLGVTA